MSYSAIIQRDSPAIVWGLNESTGTDIVPDRFLYTSSAGDLYKGTYGSGVERIKFPIVYGGGQCIKLTASNDISIPSLDKMSQKDIRNSSSIEFWIKIDSSYPSEQVFMRKDGTANETSIFIKNDHITFRFGVASRYFEVSAPIDNVNKPIHIVASYAYSYISICVNGIMMKKDIFDVDQLFETYDLAKENFLFSKPSGISNFQIDCIALYSYVLPRERALKHFVYGCGYNVPDNFINYNGGVNYNFSMNNHSAIKKHLMGAGNQWSIHNKNNVQFVDNVLTINKRSVPMVGVKSNVSTSSIPGMFQSGNKFSFNDYSYLNIKDAAEIVPYGYGGWIFSFTAPAPATVKETLFYIGSNELQSYVECFRDADGVHVDINGTITDYTNLTGSFHIGYYIDDTNANIIHGSTVTALPALKNILLSSYYIRVGSSPAWWQEKDYLDLADQHQTTCTLSEIRALSVGQTTYTDLSSLTDHYTVTPNYAQRRFIVASSGSADISIPQKSLCLQGSSTTGACRLEFGNPLGSDACNIYVVGEQYVDSVLSSTFKTTTQLTDRVIVSGNWLSNRTIQTSDLNDNKLDMLTFTVSLQTDDLEDKPAHLTYFKLSSFEIKTDSFGTYVLSNSSPGGEPAKIYGASNKFGIPDLIETPALYNGFYSGLDIIGSQTKIDNTFSSFEGNGIGIISFMMFVRSSSDTAISVLSADNAAKSMIVNATTGATSLTGFSMYVNGEVATSIKLNQWQHVILLPSVQIDQSYPILFGSLTNTGQARIDQLSFFYRTFSDVSSFVSNLYALFVGGASYTKTDSAVIDLSDKQAIVGSKVYSSEILSSVSLDSIMTIDNSTSALQTFLDGSAEKTLSINYITQTSSETYLTYASIAAGTNTTTLYVNGKVTNFVTGTGKTRLVKIAPPVTPPTAPTYTDVSIDVTGATYDPTYNKTAITLASSVASVSSASTLVFSNYPKEYNESQYQNTFINSKQLVEGQTILVYLPTLNKYYYCNVMKITPDINKTKLPQLNQNTGSIKFGTTALSQNTLYSVDLGVETMNFIYDGSALIKTSIRQKVRSRIAPAVTT